MKKMDEIKKKINKSQTPLKNFYYNVEMNDVFDEFLSLIQDNFKVAIEKDGKIVKVKLSDKESYKNKLKSIKIRRLIFEYVYKNTDKGSIRLDIGNFIKHENKALARILTNQRN